MPKICVHETKGYLEDGTSKLLKFPIYYVPKRSKFCMEVPDYFGKLSKTQRHWECKKSNGEVFCELTSMSRRTLCSCSASDYKWHLVADTENLVIEALQYLLSDYKKWLVDQKQLKKFILIDSDFEIICEDKYQRKHTLIFKYDIIYMMAIDDKYIYDESGKEIGSIWSNCDKRLIIPHTPEREQFFKAFEGNLITLITKLKKFMDIIKEDHTKLESSVKLLSFEKKRNLKRR